MNNSPEISVSNTEITQNSRIAWACKDMDTALFFPDREHQTRSGLTSPEALLAIEVCKRCATVDACLSESLAAGDKYGIFGGMTGKERRLLIVSTSKSVRK